MSVDFAAAGEPNFDIDLIRGQQGELLVADILNSLRGGSARIEVKNDATSERTGNFYFEYEAWSNRRRDYIPSGVQATHALLWAHTAPSSRYVLFMNVQLLRDLLDPVWLGAKRQKFTTPNDPTGWLRGARRTECRHGSNPTRGVIAPRMELWAAFLHFADRTTA